MASLMSLFFVCGCFTLDSSGCFCVKVLVDISIFAISAIMSLAEGVREAVLPMSDASLMVSLLSHSNMGDKSLKKGSVDSKLPARAVLFAWFGIWGLSGVGTDGWLLRTLSKGKGSVWWLRSISVAEIVS